jgi:hypothetical protein
MREYRVNGINHRVYEPEDTLPEEVKVTKNWREGDLGDWVLTDDECVIQILRRGKMLRSKGKNRVVYYIGTCTGTFTQRDSTKMDTSKRENIYSFSGFLEPNKEGLSSKESLFVYYITKEKLSPENAYLKAFPTNNKKYAYDKSISLIKTERILTAVKEELKPVLEGLGIDEAYILKGIKDEADTAEKSDTKLKALFKLCDILDLEDKGSTKVTQMTGIAFQGFDNKAIAEAERPKEIEDGEK